MPCRPRVVWWVPGTQVGNRPLTNKVSHVGCRRRGPHLVQQSPSPCLVWIFAALGTESIYWHHFLKRWYYVYIIFPSRPFLSVPSCGTKHIHYTVLCNQQCHPSTGPSHLPKQKPCPPSTLTPRPLPPTLLLSISMKLTTLGTSYKWHPVIFVLLGLGMVSSRAIHAVASVGISFLLRAECYFIVRIDHVLLICSCLWMQGSSPVLGWWRFCCCECG